MKFQSGLIAEGFAVFFAVALLVPLLTTTAMADDEVALTSTNAPSAQAADFGLFNWLDHRSTYYQDGFPQPLLVDDTSLEQEGELEFSSLDTRAGDQRSDIVSAEVQKSIGLLTLEASVPYERVSDDDDATRAVGNLDLGARYPLCQFVSAHTFFDDTIGVALEVGIPVNSSLSKNAELDPSVFNDLKLGEHFTIQTVLGYSTLFGSGDQGGMETFEYGLAFAYALRHTDLPLPGVEQLTPLFELSGETGLNDDEAGQNSLLGSAGFRLDFEAIGEFQPSLGLGYVFPVDSGARDEVHGGIVSSLIFDF